MKKVQSQASYMSEMDADGDYAELEANMHLIDEFYYGVRIFPGQDPLQVRHSRMIAFTCRCSMYFTDKLSNSTCFA